MGTCSDLSLCSGSIFPGCVSLEENTTYTVIKRLTLRGALERQEPGFIVTPLVTKEAVQQSELENLCNRIFAGSSKDMILSFLSRESVDEQQLAELKKAVEEYHR